MVISSSQAAVLRVTAEAGRNNGERLQTGTVEHITSTNTNTYRPNTNTTSTTSTNFTTSNTNTNDNNK